MTRIALLRHFPTDWNQEHRLQGITDRPLVDDSRAELTTLALPAPWRDARILASPLTRAAETARLLAPLAQIEIDARLIELTWGAWEGRTRKDLEADPESRFQPPGDLDWHDRPHGGETMAEAWERVAPLLSELSGGPSTLLVCHKALMRVILLKAAGGDAPTIKRRYLYPMRLDAQGTPGDLGEALRLVPR